MEAKNKVIQRLNEKINKHLDNATVLGGAGIGTATASFGLAFVGSATQILSTSVIDSLLIPFVGGLAATGLAVIPLTIAAGYGIRKLFQ